MEHNTDLCQSLMVWIGNKPAKPAPECSSHVVTWFQSIQFASPPSQITSSLTSTARICSEDYQLTDYTQRQPRKKRTVDFKKADCTA